MDLFEHGFDHSLQRTLQIEPPDDVGGSDHEQQEGEVERTADHGHHLVPA